MLDLEAAHELDPNSADTLPLLANCYLISGRVPNARPLITRLVGVDPLILASRCMPAWADVLEGNLEAAVGPYRQMLEMDPGNPMARLFYLWVLVLNRRGDDAGRVLEAFPSPLTRTAIA